jgi:hypothetical protein
VELLLARRDKADERALSIAAGPRGSAPVLRLLSANGAKATPDVLRVAAIVVRARARRHGCRSHGEDRMTPLIVSALLNRMEMTRLLPELGADLNAVDPLRLHGATAHR